MGSLEGLTPLGESLVEDILDMILVQLLSRARQCPHDSSGESRLHSSDSSTNYHDVRKYLYDMSTQELPMNHHRDL
jgi:hypothetical protein